MEAEGRERDAELMEAEKAAAAAEDDAANSAARLEAAMASDLDLAEEAVEMRKLREALEGGQMTGAELEKASHDAHDLSLKDKGKGQLSLEVEELAVKLEEAARAKLDAEMKALRA